ncbi:MAG TPA: hypothetical protein VN669_14285, partial [Candidatus Acidoferrales bacterium]|nr:hypothetical protein [Candidatus Acidoferrales bacterium]
HSGISCTRNPWARLLCRYLHSTKFEKLEWMSLQPGSPLPEKHRTGRSGPNGKGDQKHEWGASDECKSCNHNVQETLPPGIAPGRRLLLER